MDLRNSLHCCQRHRQDLSSVAFLSDFPTGMVAQGSLIWVRVHVTTRTYLFIHYYLPMQARRPRLQQVTCWHLFRHPLRCLLGLYFEHHRRFRRYFSANTINIESSSEAQAESTCCVNDDY